MGFALSFSFDSFPRRKRRAALLALAVVWLAGAGADLIAGAAAAETAPATTTTQAKPQDKLVIDADELVYDKDKNTVTAQGSVQLFYQGRVLQADKVIYERASKRVYAEGHAKMTDEHGNIIYGTRFELSDDFRDGFIDSVQVLTTDKTRFTSPRIERSTGDITVLQNGAYTACEPCKDHPERPPFWQVRATKIVENQETHTIYYENAQLMFWGFPVFWMPYFSSPDPTVNKQTGILAPSIVSGGNLGTGFSIPYFINLAPNYDLTLIPTYLSRQGLLGEVDWRQRLSNGIYNIRATGIDQEQPGAFPSYPYGAGGFRERGSIESAGNFLLNDMWQFGWNGTWMSDKFFLNDYRLQGINFDNFYFQDVISSIYLRGQSAQSFFDLSAYHFEGTTASDDNRTLPVAAAPVFDFNRVINVPADRTYGIGGELTIDSNVVNIDQTNAAFQSTGLQTFDNAFHLYNVCETQVGVTSVNTYFPGKCLLRGVAGDYTRATGQLSWQRSYIDPIGEVWKPFLFGRLDGEATELNETGSITYASSVGVSTVANSSQAAFFSGSSQGAFARGMAGAGLEYRYPFVSTSSWGTQTITPIAQFIARPSEVIPRIQPDEDSQSLVFDETNLFAWNKFSGYDRVEGGTRLNYGLQYTADFANGGHANFVGGESIQVAGQNSYTLYDPANTGLESGLDKKFSNFVFGETLQPTSSPITLISKQQFDSSTLQLARFDGIARAEYGGVSGSVDYALYAAQPELGWEFPREGLTGNLGYKFQDRWSVDGSLVLDMSRHYYDTLGQTTPILYPVGYSFGVGYKDECTTLTIRYSSNVSQPGVFTEFPGGPVIFNPATRNQSLMFQLVLRTLGDVKANVGVGSSPL
ncbi:MAG TPA: LPS-assembly protein LptD [Roseiarcus sp.]